MSGEEEEVVGGIVAMDAAAAKSQGSPNCGFHLMAALVGLSSPLPLLPSPQETCKNPTTNKQQ